MSDGTPYPRKIRPAFSDMTCYREEINSESEITVHRFGAAYVLRLFTNKFLAIPIFPTLYSLRPIDLETLGLFNNV
jgi:hypothetical protein